MFADTTDHLDMLRWFRCSNFL